MTVRPSLLIPALLVALSAAVPARAAQVVPSAAACVPAGGLIYVGDSSAPPVEFIDENGRPAGIHIDLLKALERELGIPITIRLMQKLEATTAMLRGEAQITALALADSRKAEFDFLSPTVRSRLSVLVRSRFQDRVASRDLSGLRIATTRESYTSRVLAEIEPAHRPILVTVEGRSGAADMWHTEQVDGMAGSAAALASLTRSRGVRDFVEMPIGTIVMHFVTNKGCGARLANIAEAMDRLRERGEVEAARDRWATVPQNEFWKTAGYAGIAGLAILVFVLGWNWTLRRQVRERTAALEAARVAAESSTKAKSEFLATMSHEIRTPLNAVIATASVLETTALDAEQRELVEVIHQGGKSLLAVVSDVLDFSKVEAGKLELCTQPFEVEALVRETVALVDRTASDKGLALTTAIEPSVPAWLSGDAHRLRQVMLNLLSNAVKFTARGSVELHVSASPVLPDPSSSIGGGTVTLRVAVRDTGVGIPADRLHRLFQPFTQADSSMTRRYGGTGLGLTISRSLVELMGGVVRVDSALGAGSTFTFEVPLPVAVAPSVSARRPLPHPAAALRVLMAEDNPINQLVQRRMITHLGHTCDVVNDGAEAMKAAAAKNYDVVVLDLQMPGVGGLEAAEAIRRQEHQPWLLVLTADVTADTRQACERAGMDDFLTKPITADALAAALARVKVVRGAVA